MIPFPGAMNFVVRIEISLLAIVDDIHSLRGCYSCYDMGDWHNYMGRGVVKASSVSFWRSSPLFLTAKMKRTTN